MARFFSKNEAALGKRPGEMVYIGKDPLKKTVINAIFYDKTDLLEKENLTVEQIETNETLDLWLNVEGISELPVIDSIRTKFDISPLIAADIVNTGIRPQYIQTEKGFFFTMKMLIYDENLRKIISEHLSIVLEDSVLITFQEAHGDVFDPVRERIKDSSSKIRTDGSRYLFFSLVDAVVDNYLRILQKIAEGVESIEEELLDKPDEKVLMNIINLRKELMFLGKTIRPMGEAVKQMFHERLMVVTGYDVFYSDLTANLSHIIETIDLYKEITAQQQNTYDTYMNNKLNSIMKFLTIFSVIFLPLSLITGIYGTNFDNIPELHLRFGYFFMWAILLVIAAVMILLFKKKKWF